MNEEVIESINKFGLTAQGRNELLKHLNGEKITRKQAMLAKCYDCCGYFCDGRADCEVLDCSLYGYMIYAKNRFGGSRTPS
jgi:hypothetical protein